ncbi:MAG: c-type cytochrome [Pseudomonadota bacterium]
MNKGIWLLGLCVLVAACGEVSDEPGVAGRWYTQSQLDLGKKVYAEHCVGCHLEDARGTTSWKEPAADGSYPPPPLNGTAHAWHHPLVLLQRTIDEGGIPLGGKMPGFKGKLNEAEKLAVISYFQSFWNDEIYAAWLERGGLK